MRQKPSEPMMSNQAWLEIPAHHALNTVPDAATRNRALPSLLNEAISHMRMLLLFVNKNLYMCSLKWCQKLSFCREYGKSSGNFNKLPALLTTPRVMARLNQQ